MWIGGITMSRPSFPKTVFEFQKQFSDGFYEHPNPKAKRETN